MLVRYPSGDGGPRSWVSPGVVSVLAIGGFLVLCRYDADLRQLVLTWLGVRDGRPPRAGVPPGQRVPRATMMALQEFWVQEQNRGHVHVLHALGTTPGEMLHGLCQAWPDVGRAGEGVQLKYWCGFFRLSIADTQFWGAAFLNPFTGLVYASGDFNVVTEGPGSFPLHCYSREVPLRHLGVLSLYKNKTVAMQAA